MDIRYEKTARPRFAIEQTPLGEQIRVPAQRQIFMMLFLPVWLTFWTFGGVTAITALFIEFQLFLLFWLCGWAFGWIMVAGTIAWMWTGSQTLRVIGTDLEVAQHVFGWTRRRLYHGAEIDHFSVATPPRWPHGRMQWYSPIWRGNHDGAVTFDYGSRTIFVAPGLDQAEGRVIIERITRLLPSPR